MRIDHAVTLLVAAVLLTTPAIAAIPENGGPYDARFIAGGIGINRELGSSSLRAGASFNISGWVRVRPGEATTTTLMSVGDVAGNCRCLELQNGMLAFRSGTATIRSTVKINADVWTHIAVSSDSNNITLYIDGKMVGNGRAPSTDVSGKIGIAPVVAGQSHFNGELVGFAYDDIALTPTTLRAVFNRRPAFEIVHIWDVGLGWEWQNKANTGLWRPQDPWTLPTSTVAPTAPTLKAVTSRPTLEVLAPGKWQVNGWQLVEAPKISDTGEAISRPGFLTKGWYSATVPGTVLQTFVDRGVYPDPYHALNNMASPESLARQDYWYRTTFTMPQQAAGKRTRIVFNGVNYASEVWINGARAGDITGAFIRGRFAFVAAVGENVVAIKVSPPPHPGTPHEQSIKGGVGENGGQMAIDGPTFVAAEGWDWIPAIRDRNTGLWQNVELTATDDLEIGDPQIITDLPLPRIDSVDVYIKVPVLNKSTLPVTANVSAAFDGVKINRTVTVPPGTTTVAFSPKSDAALRVANPKLWWPNGYGDPALHSAQISVSVGGIMSDAKTVRFGIREVSYDLSLFDSKGALRRVQVQTTDGGLKGDKLIDVSHMAIKESPRGWAESLTKAGETSAAVVSVTDYTIPEPHMTIRINGVKIAARGGNWGMDDAMKRVSRARLEPYFRLQKDAHMNVIRNWMGTNTEPEFFELADEYGMMVMNDFWQSTQNFQVEPQDPQLFLANARDAVSRYRNHPSIILWFGRNEGVPYPMLNEGLDDAVFELDGTRWFTGSSNVVNLQGSGPYNYRPPVGYFTGLATGFSVETGTPSLSTLESIQSYTPKLDQWPLSDTLAYHDWHFGGNGDTKTFMATLKTMFGEGTSLPDFERKAQMMNLETHKAMYEGMFAHLWTKNTGRLLWMTHPAWPSNAWQIYSWDYDTHAAFYGAKKASEPVHIQMNLPDNVLAIVNTTQQDHPGLTSSVTVTDLTGATLLKREDNVDALSNRTTNLLPVDLDALFQKHPMVLVALRLTDKSGGLISENFYWRGKETAAYQAMNAMVPVALDLKMSDAVADGQDKVITVTMSNAAATPALAAKLTLVNESGARILPALYSDNYVSLLGGETKQIRIRYPATTTKAPRVSLRGWNVVAQ